MTNFWQALEQVDFGPAKAIEYRVYYNDNNDIVAYSNDDLPYKYIIVDKDIWNQNRFDLKIRDGALVQLKGNYAKMIPKAGGQPCHPSDITIPVDAQSPNIQWSKKIYYEIT